MPSQQNAISWLDTIRLYARIVDHQRRKFFLGLALILLLNFHTLIPPFVVGRFTDLLATTSGEALQRGLIFWALILGTAHASVAFLRLKLKAFVSSIRNQAGLSIRSTAFQNCLFHNLRGDAVQSGASAQRISAGVDAFYDLTYLLYNEIFRALALAGSFVVILTYTRPVLLVPLLCYLIFFAVVLNVFSSRLLTLQARRAVASESSSGALADTLSGAQTIQATGSATSIHSVIESRAHQLFLLEQEMRKVSTNQWLTFHILNGLFLGIMLWGFGYMVTIAASTLGVAVTLFTYSQGLTSASADILDMWERLQRHRAALARLAPLLGTPSRRGASEPTANLTSWRTLSLSHVDFGYTPYNLIFENISLTIRRGERIAILGSSGSGKTTLVKLIAGILQPTKGSIALDQIEYTDRSELLGTSVGIALQECDVFGMSLRDNITLLRPVPESFFLQVLEVARLNSVIQRLPESLDTLLGEGGTQLSGGELQRLNIARALVKDPSLLVLDESTAMLEGTLEGEVFHQIFTLLPTATIILISHHERSVQYFPGILRVCDKGVVER